MSLPIALKSNQQQHEHMNSNQNTNTNMLGKSYDPSLARAGSEEMFDLENCKEIITWAPNRAMSHNKIPDTAKGQD